jgi:hypothetical protein
LNMLSKFFRVFRSNVSNEEIKSRINLAEDVLYGKISAGDTDALKAVADLTAAVCSNKCTCVVDAGIFIFIKVKNTEGEFQIYFKKLTTEERIILNERPSLLAKPYTILERIEEIKTLNDKRALELKKIADSNKDIIE